MPSSCHDSSRFPCPGPRPRAGLVTTTAIAVAAAFAGTFTVTAWLQGDLAHAVAALVHLLIP